MSTVGHFLERARVAYQETGLRGVIRRTTRVGLLGIRHSVAQLEQYLYFKEARARLTDEARQAARVMAGLKDSLRGRRAFILATGPSLKAVNIEPLGDEITFSVNSFHYHPVVQHWKPTFHAMMDDAYFTNGAEADYFFEEMRAALTTTRFIVPAQFVANIREANWLPMSQVLGVAMDGDFCSADWDQIDPTMLPATPNAAMFALACAVHMGCSPITLLGMDHDFLAKPFEYADEHLRTHFHAQPSLKLSATSNKSDYQDYHHVARYVAGLWRGYKNLHRIAARNGQVILNASPGSYLDVFPRTTLVDVLATPR